MQKGFIIWGVTAIIIVGGAMFYNASETKELPQQVQMKETVPQPVSPLKIDNFSPVKVENSSPQVLTQHRGEPVLNVRQLSKEQAGETVTIVARIKNVNLNATSNTAFFNVEDLNSRARIKGVIFNKTIKDNPDRLTLLRDVEKTGRHVYLTGEIDAYKDNLEIKTWKVFTEDDLH